VATVVKPGPSPCPLIRIDTNQGVYGLGEVRDGASPTYALFLKSRLLNENPLNITYLFQKIKQFGYHGRQAGGVVAVEEALRHRRQSVPRAHLPDVRRQVSRPRQNLRNPARLIVGRHPDQTKYHVVLAKRARTARSRHDGRKPGLEAKGYDGRYEHAYLHSVH